MNREKCAFGKETGKQCTPSRASDCGSQDVCDGKRELPRTAMYRRLATARRQGQIIADAFDVSYIMAVALDLPKEQVLDEMLACHDES